VTTENQTTDYESILFKIRTTLTQNRNYYLNQAKAVTEKKRRAAGQARRLAKLLARVRGAGFTAAVGYYGDKIMVGDDTPIDVRDLPKLCRLIGPVEKQSSRMEDDSPGSDSRVILIELTGKREPVRVTCRKELAESDKCKIVTETVVRRTLVCPR
jgi:hypothetical protein